MERKFSIGDLLLFSTQLGFSAYGVVVDKNRYVNELINCGLYEAENEAELMEEVLIPIIHFGEVRSGSPEFYMSHIKSNDLIVSLSGIDEIEKDLVKLNIIAQGVYEVDLLFKNTAHDLKLLRDYLSRQYSISDYDERDATLLKLFERLLAHELIGEAVRAKLSCPTESEEGDYFKGMRWKYTAKSK